MLRPALHDPARRLHEIELLGELPRLGVVQRDEVDALEQLEQIGRRLSIQKFIVSHATSFGFVDLREHVELQPRIDVAEEDERRVAKLLGNLRPEVREHAEMRLERLGGVEVVAVAAAPAERRALGALEAREIDRRDANAASSLSSG